MKCVLGVLKSEAGLRIRDEMLSHLKEKYDVDLCEVDPPNDIEFELPFLMRACEVCISSNEPVLYLHTKGAGNQNSAQKMVRRMWYHEFVKNAERYYFSCENDKDKPICSAPFVSSSKYAICWFNGFFMNPTAAKAILNVLRVQKDRYWFERGMLTEAGVQVVGIYHDCDNPYSAWSLFCQYYYDVIERPENVPSGFTPVIVSLTTWKKRIGTVKKTIDSILQNSNPYKIVLVLSKDEFEDTMAIPEDLRNMIDDDRIEILWTNGNAKSFKKILYTLAKYRNFPIVSADDDCLYKEDYVGKLYRAWLMNPSNIYTYHADTNTKVFKFGHGPACLYPPMCFGRYGLDMLTKEIVDTNHDDIYYGVLAKFLDIHVVEISKSVPYTFHDEIEPLSSGKEMNGIQAIRLCAQNYYNYVMSHLVV